eukprot:Mycagemm_TRINITY_DN10299_c1_g12::TRINITY_DN10299_c1_g12_i1::g.3930::m.3930 type:complete len:145 gc:universal TRINITY_DN10299_c1_g12_i1:327-761(+)
MRSCAAAAPTTRAFRPLLPIWRTWRPRSRSSSRCWLTRQHTWTRWSLAGRPRTPRLAASSPTPFLPSRRSITAHLRRCSTTRCRTSSWPSTWPTSPAHNWRSQRSSSASRCLRDLWSGLVFIFFFFPPVWCWCSTSFFLSPSPI